MSCISISEERLNAPIKYGTRKGRKIRARKAGTDVHPEEEAKRV